MRLYHLTNHPFQPGDRLTPQRDGYCHWPETQAMEIVLERYRPVGCLPRKASVFFTPTSTPSGDLGASGDALIVLCEVDVGASQQRSDLNWLRELDQGFNDTADFDMHVNQLAYLARGYWSGAPRPLMRPRFEYRANDAVVLACRPRHNPHPVVARGESTPSP